MGQSPTMNEIVDIADLDVVYLSYIEPQKEEFWIKIQNMIPWAVRVDGVTGSDAAHKAAADASETDRFIIIDGDNIPDPAFFNEQLILNDTNRDCVFRWKAENIINGLRYGNGGISCWTKEFIYNMKTHEASDGSDDTNIEFCFDPHYVAMHDTFSRTYPNATPEQAWMAGFREGVKMCLNKGTRPSLHEFEEKVVSRNYDNLCIWMSVGADIKNGQWAKAGALMGTFLTMLGDKDERFSNRFYATSIQWDLVQVRDFSALGNLWRAISQRKAESIIDYLSPLLRQRLNLNIVDLDIDSSKFFKTYANKGSHNRGIMITEMDVIRGIEGW